MTIEQFTEATGYVPETTLEFEIIERTRNYHQYSIEKFCKIWIKCFALRKIQRAYLRLMNSHDPYEKKGLETMIGHMAKKLEEVTDK